MPDRIGVLGAGGMGSAFAAALADGGHDVVLIGRGSAHIQAVASGGLRILDPSGDQRVVSIPAAVHAADLPPDSLDILIILTKTFDTATAARAVRPALAAGGVAVSVQNGLDNDVTLGAAFGPTRALVGVTTVGATLQRPGAISLSASTAAGQSLTHVGAMGAAQAVHRADDVVAALTSSGLPAMHAPDIAAAIWGKLALAVMSPISSVLRLTVAGVWATHDGRALVERMFDEVVDVARHVGVDVDRSAAWTHACQVFGGTGEHYTSMCTDIMNGRRTELGSMAGAVRALAETDGVPVPVHSTVLALLGALGAATHDSLRGSS